MTYRKYIDEAVDQFLMQPGVLQLDNEGQVMDLPAHIRRIISYFRAGARAATAYWAKAVPEELIKERKSQ